MMRMPYEPPKVTVMGSLRDVIQANTYGAAMDNSTQVTIAVAGTSNLNVLGS
jgi:hypothetical protein